MGNVRQLDHKLHQVNDRLAALRREQDKLRDKIAWIRSAVSLKLTARDETPKLSARCDEIDYELEMLFQRRRALLASIEFSQRNP